jgi:hypothetical protein
VFISKRQLEEEMGVDKRIGKFFVDRRVPKDNSFWKDRLLYISFGNGFLSIPVYYDILYRIGMPLEKLLDEKHIMFMEQLMHFAILQERNQITIPEELAEIRNLLNGRVKSAGWFQKLNRYLDQEVLKTLGPFGLHFPSLNRADVFLYILCDLPLNEEHWQSALKYWYALHPTYLIMDDMCDYGKDLKAGEENVVVDLGGGSIGFEKTFELYRQNCETLQEINPQLSGFLLTKEESLREYIPLNC